MNPITYTFDELLAHKDSGCVPAAALEALRARADSILTRPTLRVVDIKLPRPSGDPHDFVSMGPYWWPNPDTPDGFPWINRDGVINPDTQTGVDPVALYKNILSLSLAAFYFPEKAKEYADYAVKQIYDWYINPETKMNPNAKFGQGIPGQCEGRGAGLISFGSSYKLFNAIGILDNLGFIDAEIIEGVKVWHIEFANWILTSELGLRIDNSIDNHASWHDANLLAMAIFTDRPALIKKIADCGYSRRVKAFIRDDGSQPEELRRTLPIPYSFFNLEALMVLSNLAQSRGYSNYWAEDEERGKCILKSAVDLLDFYLHNPDSFPAGREKANLEANNTRLAFVFRAVERRYRGLGYGERARELGGLDSPWWLEPAL